MAADIVYPILIGAGALLIGVVVHFLTRPKPSRADIAVPGSSIEDAPTIAASTGELGAWHRAHESALLSFIDRFDTIAGFGPDPDEDADDAPPPDVDDPAPADDGDEAGDAEEATGDEEATGGEEAGDPAADAIEAAIEDHPAPDMRAELAALRGAADAMADAHARNDGDALERHLPVYLSYRAAWLERLWQFPVDGSRIAEIRDRDVPATGES